MGFYGKEPVDPDKSEATYVWTGLGVPGFFHVEVKGDAPNYSSGFTLRRDEHFVGGLKVDSMGWTGPLGEGTTPYSVQGSFPGEFRPEIVLSGSNGDFLLKVKEIPHEQTEDFIKKKASS